jgi:Chemoreceptor zinc-binding domain
MSIAELDVNAARMAHLRWELGLESLVNGEGGREVLKGHEDCDLGLWIYGTGLRRYGKHSSIWQLKGVHKKFHQAADQTVEAQASGRMAEAGEALSTVRRLSGEILYLLTALELDVIEASGEKDESGWGGVFLRDFFGKTPSRDFYAMVLGNRSSSGRMTLNVNGARLAHVRWIRDLQRAFRGQGKSRAPQPSEECELGVWIHGTAMKEIGPTAELVQLDAAHKRFHLATSLVLASLRKRQFRVADDVYEDALALSAEIVAVLTRLQLKFEDSSMLSAQGGTKL